MKQRTFWQKMEIYHHWNKRTGFYVFLRGVLLKLVLGLLGVALLVWAIYEFFDLKSIIDNLNTLSPAAAMPLFYVSETVLGLVPPDIFITWSEQFGRPVLWLTILGSVSYCGGITAYFLGKLALRFPKFRAWLEKKNDEFFVRIRKWGGAVIIFAALFPLPFATTATVAGMVKYPFRTFLLFGLTRYLRFYIYGIGIFAAINKWL